MFVGLIWKLKILVQTFSLAGITPLSFFRVGVFFYEVKAGPYEPAKAKEFASWAPGDNTPEAAVYLEQQKKIISEFD